MPSPKTGTARRRWLRSLRPGADVVQKYGYGLCLAKVKRVTPLTIQLSDGRLYTRANGYEQFESLEDARKIWGTPAEWKRAQLRDRIADAVAERSVSTGVLERVLALLEGT